MNWRERLDEARAAARANAGFVLDELLRANPALDLAAFGQACGMEMVLEASRVAAVLAAEPVLHVRLVDGREAVLPRDPWADAAPVPVARGSFVEPMAAPAQLVQALARSHADGAARRTTAGTTMPAAVAPAPSDDVVAFVDGAIARAYREAASDVHFECDRGGVTAKQRLDGVMSVMSRLPGRQAAEEVISRIKVLAQLDITERRLPQDGRFRYDVLGASIDLRVSVMPSVHGEDAVLRLLDKSHLRAAGQQVTLATLGFAADDAGRIRRLAGRPSGMVLITGPTGSGKTTTVYAALSEINTGLEKIITIEDPVEYELPGVLQIPVNERKGLTFARGLRSILRHDPDRILVGEIRDPETAAIAVQSALTGHLVFTTVHANSLFDVIGRFRHFGIDLFGFVSSLNGVVVQRLMRRLCAHCAGERAASDEETDWLVRIGLASASKDRWPKAAGCEHCHHTGYRGRFVVAEVHAVTDRLRDLVTRDADLTELKRTAFDSGPTPLLEQAVQRVRAGHSTLEELFRVVGQD